LRRSLSRSSTRCGTTRSARCWWRIPACRGPSIVTTARSKFIDATGLPLGLFDEADYDEFSFKAKPAICSCSTATAFSTRATGTVIRLGRNAWKQSSPCVTKSADCVVNEIFKAVTEHAAGVEAFDDQTVVAIKVKAGQPGKRK
jgi:serine phosphatase RsbU (regulator of sigma subunit)